MMRIPLRCFLVVCLLAGSVAVPVGWRRYQQWQAAERNSVKRAQVEELVRQLDQAICRLEQARSADSANYKGPRAKYIFVADSPQTARQRERVESLKARLDKLTNVRPSGPGSPFGGGPIYFPHDQVDRKSPIGQVERIDWSTYVEDRSDFQLPD